MPITQNGDPPGTRILSRFEGDTIDEEEVREWSPNGNFVKMRSRQGSDKWQQKNNVDIRMIMKLDPPPPLP
jgi:hypothetical protein